MLEESSKGRLLNRKWAVWALAGAVTVTTAAVGGTLGAATAAAKTTLTLATYGDQTKDMAVWKQVKAAFEKQYPQYELKVQISTYIDYIGKVTTQMAAGQPPDVLQTWAQYKPVWTTKGILLDLTSRVKNSKIASLDDFPPAIRDTTEYNGKIWGVPFDFGSMLWFANVDLLEEAGLPRPSDQWTVNDFAELARKVTRPDKGIWGTINPVGWAGLPNLQWTYNFTGHYWLTNDGKDVAVDDAGTIAMHKFWYDLVYQDKAAPPPNLSLAEGRNEWAGYVGVWGSWLSSFGHFSQIMNARQAAHQQMYRWTVLPIPAGPKAQNDFAQGHMWSIPAGVRRPDDAWKLVEWLGSREAEEIFVRNNFIQPMRQEEQLWNEWLSANFLPANQANQLKAWIIGVLYGKGIAKNFNYWPTYNEMASNAMNEALYNIFTGHKAIENELATAAAKMRVILAKQK
ncbi:MAG: extracellular solute-binding protein [Limnochordaceae bacterium]|nr:extracellular solute-binding protein [Limnochordaceae bacterium]